MPDVTVVVLEGAYPSSVAITVDALRAAARLAPRLGLEPVTHRVCSASGGPVGLSGGLSVATTRLRRDDRSVWVVPGLGLDTAAAVHDRLARPDAVATARALARHAGRGGVIAASCSAVFLLGAAGLLPGRRVTTTWWLAPELAAVHPDCTVDADLMVCADGSDLVTAGAALAHTDLMLHLLRAHSGAPLSDAVARAMVVDARQAQAPYVVPELLANGTELVTRIITAVEDAFPHPPSVAELAAGFAMSERTLARQVTRATGRSPLALVQSVKLRRARTLLGTSRLSVDQVAAAVGYADATALRRAMKQTLGTTPSRYRS